MELADYLRTVATQYDRHAGLATQVQTMLRRAEEHLGWLAPGGMRVIGSGGKGIATLTPWIGFFDPDETTTPEEGIYLVYLFSADLGTVSLMLLQGITLLDRKLGHKAAREVLQQEAVAIRTHMPDLDGADSQVDLRADGFRQMAYASSCIAAVTYETKTLPREDILRSDLSRYLRLYQDAIAAKRSLEVLTAPTTTEIEAQHQRDATADPLAQFCPKDEADYVAYLSQRALVKTRRHERLVREFGEWVATRGFAPSTSEHPRDLVIRRGGSEWLVEAKVLHRGNATDAVRAAIGQLFTYRHFLYAARPLPPLVALFSEPIGAAYVELLTKLSIAAVWKEDGRWVGSAEARGMGLTG